MNLEFSLLVIDDAPDNIREAIELLKEHLDEKGFDLDIKIPDDLSEENIQKLAISQGSNYDLVIVDYNLGEDNIDGALAAKELRRLLRYTDMVFYSSNTQYDLYEKLAKNNVAGVFVESRIELDVALTGLADTVIGKAVDLNHMRGIAMAQVADMDVLMEDTLISAFTSSGDQKIEAVWKITIEKLFEEMDEGLKLIKEDIDKVDLSKLVRNSQIFTTGKKYHAIRRVVKCLPIRPQDALDTLNNYADEILKKRNILAHAKEDKDVDGSTILRSTLINQQEIIDHHWMADLRNKLREYRKALNIVCNKIEIYLNTL